LNAQEDPPPVFAEDTSLDSQLPDDQRARLEVLLPQAQQVLQAIEDRMVALTIAATSRWVPEQEILDTNEQAAPVFGDGEFDHFLAMVEEVAEHAWFQEISKFLGLPEAVIHDVMAESLKAKFAVAPGRKSVGVVSHQRHNLPRS